MWKKSKEYTGSMTRRMDGVWKKAAPEKKSREGRWGATEVCVFLRKGNPIWQLLEDRKLEWRLLESVFFLPFSKKIRMGKRNRVLPGDRPHWSTREALMGYDVLMSRGSPWPLQKAGCLGVVGSCCHTGSSNKNAALLHRGDLWLILMGVKSCCHLN